MKAENTGNHYVTWTLRVLLIIMILLFAMFSLDVFEEGKGFWDTTVAFLMHNIPSFIMIIILIIAWKWENIGGALLMLCTLGFAIFLYFKLDHFMLGTVIMVGIPFIIGAMFVINHYYLGKKES